MTKAAEAKELAVEAQAPLPERNPDPILQMISDAARDPSVDINKMRALMEMKREAMQEVARVAYAEAMNKVQDAIKPIATDANNPSTKSKYATYHALDKALRPIYTAHGFSLNFDTADPPAPDTVRVVCDLTHVQGHERRYKVDMPADGKGAKGGDVMTKTHATGSALSYGMRYLLKMIFNIAIVADDDGNAAGETPISPEQRDELIAIADERGVDKAEFCKKYKIPSLADIQTAHFARAKTAMLSFPVKEAQAG